MTVKGFLGKVSVLGMVSTLMTLGSAIHLPVHAQFTGCVNAGRYQDWGNFTRDVSIGREIHKAIASINPRSNDGDSVVTCRVSPTQGGSFSYAVGFDDVNRNTPPALLIIYLNGNEHSRQTIHPGQLYTNFINTQGVVTSISIEAVCTRVSTGCAYLQFTKLEFGRRRLPGAR
jgi:hypothetical protein